MLNHRLHVAHAPHRWYALEQEEHGVNQLRVPGGVCQCCLDVAMEFYDGRVRINGEIKGQAYGIEIESEKKGNLEIIIIIIIKIKKIVKIIIIMITSS